MNILFWVPYPKEGASNRYRVGQYLPYLERVGINCTVRPFWSSSAYRILYRKGYHISKCGYFILGTISRLLDLFMLFRYDFVFIHREAYPLGGAFFEGILTILKKPFIFDFDDAIFLPATSRSNNFIERYKKPAKVGRIVKMSKHVIAGNGYLADYAREYNNSVSVIPTPIDTDKYQPDGNGDREEVLIGWIGSVTTITFLDMVKRVFIRLSENFSNLKFKIIGGDFSVSGLSNIISKPWSLNSEIEDLRSLDIGIMPMPDNDWTKGKCGFKAIVYMSMGLPCVCSPVGVNKEIITDGVDGFLANTEDEWFDRLANLIKNRQLRQEIGRAARATVEKRYSLSANAPKYLKILEEFCNVK